MNDSKNRPTSNAEWYYRKDPENERFYEIFFRLTYERDKAQRLGLPLSEVRPSFAS